MRDIRAAARAMHHVLTAHGRASEQVVPWFWPGARLLILTAGPNQGNHLHQLQPPSICLSALRSLLIAG